MAPKTKWILGIVMVLMLVPMVFGAVRTLYVEEGDFVRIEPEVVDLDKDKVTFTYSEPFDRKGEWQTDLNDAGEYEVEIIASDGEEETVEKVKLIVENKNQAPRVLEKKLVAKETQKIDLRKNIEDPDKDALQYNFKPPFNKNGVWQTGHDDEGEFLTTFTVSDGEFTVDGRVQIEVLNTNQPPTFERVFEDDSEITIREDEELKFFVEVSDSDGDEVNVEWTLDGEVISSADEGSVEFDFESAGSHSLIAVASDGSLSEELEWNIEVEDKNRKPELDLLPVTVNEGEKVLLEVSYFDVDGDSLTYSFEEPFNEIGEWQTGFEDAGVVRVDVTVTDGEFTETQTVKVTVLDVDLPPSLHLPESLVAVEGEKFSWMIDSNDPDGDKITLTIEGAPERATLSQTKKRLEWTPDYDFIKRKGNWWSNLLNRLRVEHFFLKKKTNVLNVTSCGKEACSSGTVKLVTRNVNRAPVLDDMDRVTVTENEHVLLEPSGEDPDGDIIKYYFSEPVSRRGGTWQTDYESEGKYTVEVTGTDGWLEDTETVKLTVNKSNREPTITVRHERIVVNEGHEFLFRVVAEDPDGDELRLVLDNPPAGSSFEEGAFLWRPGFDVVEDKSSSWWQEFIGKFSYLNKKFSKDREEIWLTFSASDEEFTVIAPVKIVVKNVNQAPFFNTMTQGPLKATTGEPVRFFVDAIDLDNDVLEYEWKFGFGEDPVRGTDKISRTFITPGKKIVGVEVTDGTETITQEWTVNVDGPRLMVKPEEKVPARTTPKKETKKQTEPKKPVKKVTKPSTTPAKTPTSPPPTFKVVVIRH